MVEGALEQALPAADVRPAVLHEAMRYSVFSGGKRLRPIFCLAAAEAVGGEAAAALPTAAALEIFHTYTLIHDDMPALDDDALRRGKPTAHVQYGEANAILAGDALLTLTFAELAKSRIRLPYSLPHIISEFTAMAGSQGIVGGQVEDVAAEGVAPSEDLVLYIHTHKTALLLRSAVRLGAMMGGASAQQLAGLTRYGEKIGLAFQLVDDLLDGEAGAGSNEGAPSSDLAKAKVTAVAVWGEAETKRRVQELITEATSALPADIHGEILSALARYIVLQVA